MYHGQIWNSKCVGTYGTLYTWDLWRDCCLLRSLKRFVHFFIGLYQKKWEEKVFIYVMKEIPGEGGVLKIFFGKDVPLGKWKLSHTFTKFWPKIGPIHLPAIKNLPRFWEHFANFMLNFPKLWRFFFSKICYWKKWRPIDLPNLGLRRGHSFTRVKKSMTVDHTNHHKSKTR